MKKEVHFNVFDSCEEAEAFVRDHLTYKNGKCKDHIMERSVYWKCWIVLWKGRLVRS